MKAPKIAIKNETGNINIWMNINKENKNKKNKNANKIKTKKTKKITKKNESGNINIWMNINKDRKNNKILFGMTMYVTSETKTIINILMSSKAMISSTEYPNMIKL